MKKILFIFFIIIISLFFFLLFNDKGNEYLKPYLATYLASKSEQNISVKVEHLKIDSDYIELTALVNNLTTIDAHGKVLMLEKKLDIIYTINSNGFKNDKISFSNKIDINGTVKGDFDDLNIEGRGNAFQSRLNYKLNYKDELVNNINIKMFKADIAELLALTAQPAYAKGKIDIDVNIPSLDENTTRGKADIVLYHTQLNEKVINKEFKTKLPKNTTLTGTINSNINNKQMIFDANIKSNLATLTLKKALYHLDKNELFSNFTLTVPKLSTLSFLTDKKLFGRLKTSGSVQLKNKLLTLNTHTNSLGGNTVVSLKGKQLNLNFDKTKIEKILHLLGEKTYVSGKLNGKVKLSDLENLKGTFTLHTTESKTIHKILKKEFKIDLQKSIAFELTTKGNINTNSIYANSNLNSKILKLNTTKMIYNINTKALQTAYQLHIPELSNLSSISKTKLYGAMKLVGEVKVKNKKLILKAQTSSLGGVTNITLNEKQLDFDIRNTNIQKILHLMGEKPYVTGLISGDGKFSDVENLTGTFNVTTHNTKTIHRTIKKEFGLDFGEAVSFQMNSSGNIEKNIAHIQSNIDSNLFTLTSNNMNYNLKNSLLQASYVLNVPNLAKLNKLAGKNLQGKLLLKGKIKSDKSLLLTGHTNDLGGNLDFKLQQQQLNSNIKGVSVQRLMSILDYPQIFKAKIDGNFNYNLKTQRGILNSKLLKAQLLPNTLTEIVQQVRGVDLTKERYNQTTFMAHLNKNEINFDFNAESRKVLISLPNGHINKLTNTINSKYKLKIENKDIEGKIQGSISKPHITIDSSRFIQEQVVETIKDKIGKDRLKDLGIGEKETEVIKNILGDLFK